MKAIISVTRRTHYTSIVEMTKADFKRLSLALISDDKRTVSDAEEELNSLIDVHDWQDDSLDEVDQFEEYKPV